MVVRQGEKIRQAAAGAGLRVRRAVDHTRNSRVDHRTCAHRTGLQRHIERAFPQPPAAQRAARLIYGLQLGMAQGILRLFPAVPPASDDALPVRNDAAHRHLALGGRLPRQTQGLAHVFFVRHLFITVLIIPDASLRVKRAGGSCRKNRKSAANPRFAAGNAAPGGSPRIPPWRILSCFVEWKISLDISFSR